MLQPCFAFQAVQNSFSSDPLPPTQVHEFLGKKQQVKREYRTNNYAPSAHHIYETFCVCVCFFFWLLFPALSSFHTSWGGGDRCGDICELNSGYQCENVILGFFFTLFVSHARDVLRDQQSWCVKSAQINQRSADKMCFLKSQLKPFSLLPRIYKKIKHTHTRVYMLQPRCLWCVDVLYLYFTVSGYLLGFNYACF